MSDNRRPMGYEPTSSGTPYQTNLMEGMTFDTRYDNYEQDINFKDKHQADLEWDHDYPPRKNKRQRGCYPSSSSYSEPSSSYKPKPCSPEPGINRSSNCPLLKTPHQKYQIPLIPPPTAPEKNIEPEVPPSAQASTIPKKIYTEVLRANKLPSPQIAGRLELALGVIMKNIHEKYGIYAKPVDKIMKQTIRERIRDVMLWKIVGNHLDVVKEYRKKFPERTDKSVVYDAIDIEQKSQPSNEVPLPQDSGSRIPLSVEESVKINSGTGEDNMGYLLQICSIKQGKWFRNRMKNLITKNISEMFTKVIAVYSKEHSRALSSGESYSTEDTTSKSTENPNEGSAEIMEEFQELFQMFSPIVFKRITAHISAVHIEFLTNLVFNAMATNNNNLDKQNKEEKEQSSEVQTVEERPKLYVDDPNFVYDPYFLRVTCKPCLPEKEVMKAFLQQFNPKLVKKHKHIKNLLFVGFIEKDDFEGLLACNGCQIGNATLKVTISNIIIIPKTKNTETSAAPNDKNDSLSDIITGDLDNQISELLDSIKKAEEKEFGKLETNQDTEPEHTDQDKENEVIYEPDNAPVDFEVKEDQDIEREVINELYNVPDDMEVNDQDNKNKDLNRTSDDDVIFVGSNSDIETIDLLDTTLE